MYSIIQNKIHKDNYFHLIFKHIIWKLFFCNFLHKFEFCQGINIPIIFEFISINRKDFISNLIQELIQKLIQK